MKKFHFLLLLLLFIGISCTNTEGPQDLLIADYDDIELKKASNKFVPFSGTFDMYIDEVLHNPPPPPKVQVVLGTGNANHMGSSSVYMEQNWWPPGPPPLTPPWSGTGNGIVEFTAANGDILKGFYTDGVGFHETETVVYVTYTIEFVDGGTGRFTYAEGSIEWGGLFNPVENFGTASFTGEIKYSRN